MFEEGHQVGKQLAGMQIVGQAINNRYTRTSSEALNDRVLVGSNHDRVRTFAQATRAVSSGGSPRPSWVSWVDRKIRATASF